MTPTVNANNIAREIIFSVPKTDNEAIPAATNRESIATGPTATRGDVPKTA